MPYIPQPKRRSLLQVVNGKTVPFSGKLVARFCSAQIGDAVNAEFDRNENGTLSCTNDAGDRELTFKLDVVEMDGSKVKSIYPRRIA